MVIVKHVPYIQMNVHYAQLVPKKIPKMNVKPAKVIVHLIQVMKITAYVLIQINTMTK